MKTVRVRIAVVVDEKGRYNSAGWNNCDDNYLRASAVESFEPEGMEAVYFIEADVPLPESKTVEGTVAH